MEIERLIGIYNGYALKPNREIIEKFTLMILPKGRVRLNTVNFVEKGTITLKNQKAFIVVQSEKGNQIQYIFSVGKMYQSMHDSILIGVYSSVTVSGNISAGRVLLEMVENESMPRYIPLDKLEDSDFLHSKLNRELINKYLIELPTKEETPKKTSIESLQSLIQDFKNNIEDEIKSLKENQEQIIKDLKKQINGSYKQINWKIDVKKLIGNSQLEEAIEEILKITLDFLPQKYNETISLNARLSQLDMEFRIGILSDESRRNEIAKINQALLKLIDTIEFKE